MHNLLCLIIILILFLETSNKTTEVYHSKLCSLLFLQESWPKSEEDTKDDSSAFTPEILERGLAISLPHIDDPLIQDDGTVSLPAVPSKSSPPSFNEKEQQQ